MVIQSQCQGAHPDSVPGLSPILSLPRDCLERLQLLSFLACSATHFHHFLHHQSLPLYWSLSISINTCCYFSISSKLPEYACFFHVSGPSAKNAFAIYFWSKLNHSSRLSLGLTSSRKPSPHLVSHCFGDFFTQSCHCRSLGPCSPTIP